MSLSHPTIVYAVLILLFGFPLAFNSVSKNLFRQFSFEKFISVFNKSFLHWIIIGLTIFVFNFNFAKFLYSQYDNAFLEIFSGTVYCYLVIGMFCFVPSLGLLNLINLIVKKLKQT